MVERIDIHPDICNGRPVIAGTRIPVQTIMEFLGADDSIDEVLEAYPSLKKRGRLCLYPVCCQINGESLPDPKNCMNGFLFDEN